MLLDILKNLGRAVGAAETDAALADRVKRYRAGGEPKDGIRVLNALEIGDVDYALMGADNSCARINHPGVPEQQRMTGRWFAIDRSSRLSREPFGNSHGTSRDGGKTYHTESAFLGFPASQYQASPAEVVWHHKRVSELRDAGIAQPERMRIMTGERASRPWAQA